MTGSLYEKYGTYYAVLAYKDKNKKKARKWISTGYDVKGNKKKAEAKLTELIEEYKHLEYKESEIRNAKPLFVESVKEWIANKENKVERSTYEGYKSYIDYHIIPYFEPLNLNLDEVTPKHIKDYYENKFRGGRYGKESSGLNIHSIKKHGMVMKQIFKDAVITEQITRNPASGVPLPKNEKPEFKGKFLDGNEANQVLQALEGHELQAMVFVTLYYGLRRSEALGLRWSSVNFEENTITIEHTVVRVLSIEYKDKTKSKTSMATFPLLADVREILLKLKDKQDENEKIFGNTYYKSDYIFKWPDGKLYRPDYITRSFKRVLKKQGLKIIRFHDLRHSTASILYDKGWDMKAIQDWLRHAYIETTGNIYTHITYQRKQTTAKDLENTFSIKQ